MKITAELTAIEILDADETEKDVLLKISCEAFESEQVILELPDGRKFQVDANDILEAVSRTALELPIKKEEEK
jgi:hypothetical protein